MEQSVEAEAIEHKRSTVVMPAAPGTHRVIQAGSNGERELTYNKTIVTGK